MDVSWKLNRCDVDWYVVAYCALCRPKYIFSNIWTVLQRGTSRDLAAGCVVASLRVQWVEERCTGCDRPGDFFKVGANRDLHYYSMSFPESRLL